jgi:hypothetical protein
MKDTLLGDSAVQRYALACLTSRIVYTSTHSIAVCSDELKRSETEHNAPARVKRRDRTIMKVNTLIRVKPFTDGMR